FVVALHYFVNLSFADNFAAVRLKQLELSITKAPGRTAKFTCAVSGVANLDSTVIHWYRARAGQAPERILYYSSGDNYDPGFTKAKHSSNKVNNIFTLTISKASEEDNGYYYCACWDVH
uniref:Ig-like domain-containing protein n=1 Tax=Latimeria chalumnae TaxID=7897 RepID=H2ZTM6_LATCH